MIFYTTRYGRCSCHLGTGWLSEYQEFSDIPLDTIWKMFVSFRDRFVDFSCCLLKFTLKEIN